MQIKIDTVQLADCHEWLLNVPNQFVDQINIDPPYGVTWASWDNVPNWSFLSEQFDRILKKSGSMFIWGVQPMLAEVHAIFSRQFAFRFEFIWDKIVASWSSDDLPIKLHENLWWYVKKGTQLSDLYIDINSIKEIGDLCRLRSGVNPLRDANNPNVRLSNKRFPKSIVRMQKLRALARDKHPTQKPEKILSMIVKMACPVDGVILDCFAGSGILFNVARTLKRHFIGCENNPEYYALCQKNLRVKSIDLTNFMGNTFK